jgi:hypothetical protein
MLSMVFCSNVVVRQNANTQLEALIKEKEHLASKCKVMEEGINPVLDQIGMEPEEGSTDRPVQPEAIVEKCHSSWACFKQFVHDAGEYVATHVLAVVWSHYLGVDLRRLEAGVSINTDPVKAEELRATSQAMAAKMISDVDLCGETG